MMDFVKSACRRKVLRVKYFNIISFYYSWRKLTLLAIASTLFGCANCVNLNVLRPQVESAAAFKAFYNEASGNEIFLKSDAFSVWLKPCNDGRSITQGTICAMLFVSEAHELKFSSNKAVLFRKDGQGSKELILIADDFNFSQSLNGSNLPAASNSPFAYEPHKQPGSKWHFSINKVPDFNEMNLKLPTVLVDGKSVEIPEISFSPIIAQQCFTFH